MTVDILQGDCREVLKTLPEKSVQTVITSPPYWGLRDYGTATWEGGDAECDHAPDKRGSRFATPHSAKQASNTGSGTASRRDCDCGAVRQDVQLGLEPTPEQYVENMVAVFREVRRVLRDDGTLWLNLGDSYVGGNNTDIGGNANFGSAAGVTAASSVKEGWRGLPAKNLVGIPWRIAFALQADGWWLRSDIIWAKPNPMPESVTDRPTRSHEYVFLLSKSARYYWDADAIREPHTAGHLQQQLSPNGNRGESKQLGKQGLHDYLNPAGRNKRTVWEIATQPYSEAHFATFPEALVKPCIQAGTSERGQCVECGKPWVRVVERTAMVIARTNNHPPELRTRTSGTMVEAARAETTGWRPSCAHEGEPVPQTVLDPFGGSGTVGVVAKRAGRKAILIDASEEYCELARKRVGAQGVLL